MADHAPLLCTQCGSGVQSTPPQADLFSHDQGKCVKCGTGRYLERVSLEELHLRWASLKGKPA